MTLTLAVLTALGTLHGAVAPRSSSPLPAHPPVDSEVFTTIAEKLVAAAAFGDLPSLDRLLEQDTLVDPNAEPDYRTSVAVHREIIPPGSPLNAAIIAVQPRAIVRLLTAGADPLRLPGPGSNGPSTFPLATAAVQNHPALLKAFHSAGVSMEGTAPMTVEGWSVLHLVAWGMFLPQKIGRSRALDFLLGDKNGPQLDPNVAAAGPADDWVEPTGGIVDGVLPPSIRGSRPLHEAARKGNAPGVASLLRHGADPLLRDDTGRLALHYAVEVDGANQDEVVSLLLEAGNDASALLADNAGDTALALVEQALKNDRAKWDSLTAEEQGDGELPDRFPSMLRLLEEKRKAKKSAKKKKKKTRADKEWEAEEKRRAEMKRLAEELRRTSGDL